MLRARHPGNGGDERRSEFALLSDDHVRSPVDEPIEIGHDGRHPDLDEHAGDDQNRLLLGGQCQCLRMPFVVERGGSRTVNPDRNEVEPSPLDLFPECWAGRDDDVVTSGLHRLSERYERKEMATRRERGEHGSHTRNNNIAAAHGSAGPMPDVDAKPPERTA